LSHFLHPIIAASDRSILAMAVFATLVVSIVVTCVLMVFVKGSKTPIAMGICGVGAVLMMPMLFTEAWSILPADSIPESISVPTFIAGFALLFVAMFVWRWLQRLGAR
jgi:hypothetical protein